MKASGFSEIVNVSRETLERLETYVSILGSWQSAVNLVGRKTLNDVWRRHILDSAQLFPVLPSPIERLIDFGSGAGFPGMVLAIMGVSGVELIEANARKCSFLHEVARVTGTSVVIHNKRIEQTPTMRATVITARALAPLSVLLKYSEPFTGPETICLFLKGNRLTQELTEAEKLWKMGVKTIPSLSGGGGNVLLVKALSRKG